MMAGSEPVPDPTVLTTEQLLREVDRVKELMDSELRSLERECLEKFRSMAQQFELVEKQRVEQKTDTKDAVDAAFSAAKEAVREQTTASDRAIAKSENSMLEQLKQLGSTFTTAFAGMQRDIDDLKERTVGAESEKRGAEAGLGTILAVAAIAAAIVGVIVAALPL